MDLDNENMIVLFFAEHYAFNNNEIEKTKS